MDISVLKAELTGIQTRLGNLVENVKSTNRDLSDAEIKSIEADNARAKELKFNIEFLERNPSGSPAPGLHQASDGSWEDFKTGQRENSAGVKGFLTPDSIKAVARAGSAQGIKALVAAGSSTTPVPLATAPILLGQPSLGLLSLIPVTQRDTPTYSYLRQSVRTNNAAVVAPGATKPTSVYTVAKVDGSLAVYAHLSEPVDKYVLEDNSDLERFLDGELRNGVIRKVTSDAITAFSNASGAQTLTTSASYTAVKGLDAIYQAASLIADAGFTPNLIVLSRDKYDGMRLAKNADGDYYGGNPFEGGDRGNLWGGQTLISSDIPSGTALVLDTSKVGLSVDRSGIVTDWDSITGFANNTVRARTEGRFGFDVFVPAGIAKITFTA